MTEKNKTTHYEEDEGITCPKCGSNNWKLFKYSQGDGYFGFRVACANGCYIDNINIIVVERGGRENPVALAPG